MNCRSCCHAPLASIIPLGKLPLANALLKLPLTKNEPLYNLEVMLCPSCGLAQLKDHIDPKKLFSQYIYFSSNSETMLRSAKELVDSIVPSLNKDALVVEVASNDGYLLKNYLSHDIKVLGIDPAKNIAKVANENGIETLCDFFGQRCAKELIAAGKKADIIHANNVMAHVPDLNGFMAGLKLLLKQDGYAVIEVPYFLDLVEKLEFDTIYHEHVYYFSVKPLRMAFERYGLEIFNVEKIPLHGGSLRLFVSHKGAKNCTPQVADMVSNEIEKDLYDIETYTAFMKRLSFLKENLIGCLDQLNKENKQVACYGASAKGTTLLNYFGIGEKVMRFVVDKSIAKQGLYTPGMHLEVRDPKELVAQDIDYALLLVWNFEKEIIHQQQEFIDKGGRFIVPVPEVRIAS